MPNLAFLSRSLLHFVGTLPQVYFKALQSVSPLEIRLHALLWAHSYFLTHCVGRAASMVVDSQEAAQPAVLAGLPPRGS